MSETTLRPARPNNVAPLGVAGVVGGAVLLGLGFSQDAEGFWGSYLIGWSFMACLVFGCFAVQLLHHAVRSRWGLPFQRVWEAGGGPAMLGFTLLAFVPILLNMDVVYHHWMDPAIRESDPIVAHKAAYLSPLWFIVRTVAFFAGCIAIAHFFQKWTKMQESTGDHVWETRRSILGCAGMLFFVIGSTIAWTDWIMSLDPHWFSTIWGVWFVAGQALAAFAIAGVVVGLNFDKEPYNEVLWEKRFVDYGLLMLAGTMFWAYCTFSQYLIIWAGNLPEFNSFYMDRLTGGFHIVGNVLIGAGFLIPFLFLIDFRIKRNPRALLVAATIILIARVVDVYYVIKPFFDGATVLPTLADIGAFLLFGGLWAVGFAVLLTRAALLPKLSTLELKEAHDHV